MIIQQIDDEWNSVITIIDIGQTALRIIRCGGEINLVRLNISGIERIRRQDKKE